MTFPGAAGLRVERTGPQLLVEDLGRPGLAHLGVPPSGALDRSALALANRLVGNPEGAAGLEALLGGCVLVAERSLRLAVTGASVGIRVDDRAMPWGQPVPVTAGARLELGPVGWPGLRCWLAVGGGIAVAPVLGSRSTDVLTGLGPAPVGIGDRLPVGDELGEVGSGSAVPDATRQPLVLDLAPGPRRDWLTDDALERLTAPGLRVMPASNRVALRLSGLEGLPARRTHELPSEGVLTGAVQLPPSGQPVVFLADHPVTGGYPVVGVVSEAGLRRCAQARPGDSVRFGLR
ncbi:MAG TPA: biotin-dependent carboxyltransferase family protein [Nocardioidaceae bacterium]|nr:biotin-dependent carboxyltransferase family protein [Nocardioidaceae bacterium]